MPHTLSTVLRSRAIAALTDGQKACIVECARIYSKRDYHGTALAAKVAETYANIAPTTIKALLIDRGIIEKD